MQKLKIIGIKKIPKRDRYDLTINSTHNFFANGILIHNTSGIFSYVLCKQQLNWKQKIAKYLTGYEFNEYDYNIGLILLLIFFFLFSKDKKYNAIGIWRANFFGRIFSRNNVEKTCNAIIVP